MGTKLGSLLQVIWVKFEGGEIYLKRSVLVPTVEMQTLLGQTFRNSPIVFFEFGVTLSRNSRA